MSGGMTERLDPATRVPATQAEQPWREEDPRKRRGRKTLPKKAEPTEEAGEPPHQFDDLA